jgi:hypothetical protein
MFQKLTSPTREIVADNRRTAFKTNRHGGEKVRFANVGGGRIVAVRFARVFSRGHLGTSFICG